MREGGWDLHGLVVILIGLLWKIWFLNLACAVCFSSFCFGVAGSEFFLLESFVWVSPGPGCILSLLGSWSEFVDRAAAGFRRSVFLSSVHRFHSRSFGFLHALGLRSAIDPGAQEQVSVRESRPCQRSWFFLSSAQFPARGQEFSPESLLPSHTDSRDDFLSLLGSPS
jgi:hypothetical protein